MDANFWKDYTKNTGLLTWRLALPEDQPAIDKLREATERTLREKQKAPDLFARPVLLALVAEDADGEIVDAMYAEAQVEIVKMGLSETGLLETSGIAPDLDEYLRGMGFKTATIRTRKSLKEKMSVVLEYLGFECEDGPFSRWTRDL
jgi:methyl coenzyme M reductase subunit C-like uncharacterized protein (methanogenesis marker protein 7)